AAAQTTSQSQEFLNLMLGALQQNSQAATKTQSAGQLAEPVADIDQQLASLMASMEALGLDTDALNDQLAGMDLNGQLALISDLLSSVADQLPADQHGLVRALHQGIEAFENVLAGHKAWAEAPGPLSDQAVVTLPEQAALQAQNQNQNHAQNSPTAKGLLGLPETAQANQKADALLPGQTGALHVLRTVLNKLEWVSSLADDWSGHKPAGTNPLGLNNRPLPQLALQSQLASQLSSQIDQALAVPVRSLPSADTNVDESALPPGALSQLGLSLGNHRPAMLDLSLSSQLAKGVGDASPAQDQIVEAARAAVEKGEASVQLHLKPEALGRVRIQLSTDASQQVTARIVTEQADTKAHLEFHLKDLHQALERQGIQVARVTV
ncbi:MAG: flagellar hook-length control protein FliK, partial [Cyanobacteria bacterium HKST-UBA05]|nr:flagellar hook-length control protein FliK [Cyanobacteria bacterium HKST-UBA05]